MLTANTTFRAALSVCVVLGIALIFTAFVSSAYERERTKLGERHFRAGQALTRADDLKGAAEEFRKALLFAPDNREYRLSLATALFSDAKLDEAESHLEQLSQEDPTNGKINLLLARVALRQHHPNQAMESYQRAVYEYWPPDEYGERRAARWELIDLLASSGNHRDQLVGELLQLYGNLPPHSDQRLRVANLLLREHADAEAGHVFEEVLKDTPSQSADQAAKDSVVAHNGLAKIALNSGDFVSARHHLQRAQRFAPDDLSTAGQLQLINEIIDIAPELPNISSSERLRRSQNLLNRVAGDLQNCTLAGEQSESLAERLEALKQASKRKPNDESDQADLLQDAAQQLWRTRADFCGPNRAFDPAVEAVLPLLVQ